MKDLLPDTLYVLAEFQDVLQVIKLTRETPPGPFLVHINRFFGPDSYKWCTHYGTGLRAADGDSLNRSLFLGAPDDHCQLFGYIGYPEPGHEDYWHVDHTEYYLPWATSLEGVWLPWSRRLNANRGQLDDVHSRNNQRRIVAACAEDDLLKLRDADAK